MARRAVGLASLRRIWASPRTLPPFTPPAPLLQGTGAGPRPRAPCVPPARSSVPPNGLTASAHGALSTQAPSTQPSVGAPHPGRMPVLPGCSPRAPAGRPHLGSRCTNAAMDMTGANSWLTDSSSAVAMVSANERVEARRWCASWFAANMTPQTWGGSADQGQRPWWQQHGDPEGGRGYRMEAWGME